ncbi:MAG: DUF5666 domain-containing protein [Ardenticatenaceae bacterium]|nr:DUF5666 domain-containing protein [Ardenticatenaceae bacterium]
MSELEQILQQRIEQLEAGEPLEACLAGLPKQEAEALQLIAAVRSLSVDDADEALVAAQRAEILGAAATHINGSAVAPASAGLLERIKAWFEPLKGYQRLAVGLAPLFLILIVTLAFWGVNRGNDVADGNPVAVISENGTEAELAETAAEETGIAGEVASEEPAVEVAAEAEAGAGNEEPVIFMPLLTSAIDLSPQTAVVEEVQGVVQIQTGADEWTAVTGQTTLAAGQRVRTGDLSQVTLTFYDGSQAFLGADTEISVDELDAQKPENGFRTIVMTQWAGDSEHSVEFRNDRGSRYEVKTPTGSGVARGTKFRVLVIPNRLARYIVTEGKVDVSGQSRTVSVTAGQLTTFPAGGAPQDPAFNISGEGEVTAVGAVWTIAGQTFQTGEQTIIVGNPEVGDVVKVDGHLLPDGTRVADFIILLRRAVANQFTLSGEVEEIGPTWTVAGQAILINADTVLDPDIVVGDKVRVDGLIMPGGSLLAQEILRLEEALGLPFQLSGVVQAISPESWTISGQVITVNDETVIDGGDVDIAIGDVVDVRGWILEDDSWLATEITLQTEEVPTFEISGEVESIDPWVVSGIDFETRPWTNVAPNIAVGDRVRVQGTILSDGTRVADAITLLDETQPNTIIFIGLVGSIDPWIVNGLPLIIPGEASIFGNVVVGSLVVVQAQLLPDGTWTVLSIRLLYPESEFGVGCLVLSTPIIAVTAEFIQVKHWSGNIDRSSFDVENDDDIKENAVVALPICAGIEGPILITTRIIVIYRPTIIIIDDGGGAPPPQRGGSSDKSS